MWLVYAEMGTYADYEAVIIGVRMSQAEAEQWCAQLHHEYLAMRHERGQSLTGMLWAFRCQCLPDIPSTHIVGLLGANERWEKDHDYAPLIGLPSKVEYP